MKNSKSECNGMKNAELLFHYSLQSHNFSDIQGMKYIVKNK